ncbi:DUF3526 domain-containing protein [bacterium]|nr:MAG: DUF3526 domain-containing protein [bacterium]
MAAIKKNESQPAVFWAVVTHEARLLWRSGAVLLLFLFLALWMALATMAGKKQGERQNALARRAHAKDAAVLEKNTAEFAKDPQGFRGKPYTASLLWRQHATLPAGPLAVLDAGQSDLRPSVYNLHTDWEKVFMAAGPLRNESALRTGHFDVGFLSVQVLPLVVIALCFGVLASDRERGTMLILLSQPVSQSVLLGAALLVRFLLLQFMFLGLAAIFGFGFGTIPVEAVPRFLLWSAVVTAYLVFWFAVAAVVVSTGGRAAMNALVLVMSWVVLTIAVPGAIGLAASARYTVPPRTAIIQQVNVARDEAFENWRDNEKSFRLFYRDFPELIPPGATVTARKINDPLTSDSDFQSRVMIVIPYALEQLGLRLSRPHRQAVQGKLDFIRQSRWLSPVVAAREGLMDVAGSGDARFSSFDAQVASFWKEWRYHWVKPMFRGPRLTVADYGKVPRFYFQEESVSDLATRLFPGLFATLLLSLLLFVGATVVLRRHNSPLPSH